MERIVALVEGHTETHFVQAAYGNAIVQRPFANGDSVSLDLIAEAIIEHLDTVSGSISKVLILLDREGRDVSAADMRESLRTRIQPHCGKRSIYIGVSDRQVENWILADVDHVRKRFNAPDFNYLGDGSPGKNALKRLAGGDASFRDKADWLKCSTASAARVNSGSLDEFLQQIDFLWPWAMT